MKLQKQMISRLQNLLVKDKLGLSDGFMVAFKADITHLVGDYFALQTSPEVKVETAEDGKYTVIVTATATQIKQFGTTLQSRN